MFIVYIIVYSGNLMPPFYIGSTSLERFESGYMGSISSKKYKEIYFDEVRKNPHLFERFIISTHSTRKEALEYEKYIHDMLDVVKSKNFINMSTASINGFFGMDVIGENNPNFGNRWDDEKKERASLLRKSEEYKNKTKQTNLERYGVENPTQCEKIQEKTKQTNLERYGASTPFGNYEVWKKGRETKLERYGDENYNNPEKNKQTKFERYGHITKVKTKSEKSKVEKFKESCLDRYGVENVFQSEEIKEKIKLKNLEKYGVENPSQNPEIMKKMITTRKNNDILFNRKYDGEKNSNSKKIIIYNHNDEVQFECNGTFKQVCKDNNLPYGPLYSSYRNNGERIFIKKHSIKHLNKNPHNQKFINWYAKLVE